MASSFSAEVLKLRKRPATWVLGIIFVVSTVLFGYLLNYLFLVNAPEGQQGVPPETREVILTSLLPESFLSNVIGTFANFGSALALIIGALAIGSEYGWDTFKVSLTQRPGRLGFLAGKFLSVVALMLIVTVVILAVGAVASYTIAGFEDAAVEWPPALEILKGVGAGWLILTTYAAMGMALAMLFRGTALAIGLGLVYLLLLEGLFIELTSRNETISKIGNRLPYTNSLDLSQYFGQAPQGFGGAPGETIEPAIAALTLGIYAMVFIALAVVLFKSRDVT